MATVRMVEVTANQIIRVVGVGNRLVPTARGVRVPLIMLLAGVRWGAGCRVASICLEAALIDVITMGMMEVPLRHVIAVVAVLDRSVSTTRTGLCRKFCSEGREGAGAPVGGVIRRLERKTMRPP